MSLKERDTKKKKDATLINFKVPAYLRSLYHGHIQ